MAELHTNIYVKNPLQDIHSVLTELFLIFRGAESEIETKLLNSAVRVSPNHGETLLKNLLQTIEKLPGTLSSNLIPESKDVVEGYHCWHFVHGGWGDEVIPAIIKFFKALAPDSDIRAWTYGDDDPWEIIYGYKDSQLVEHYYEPDMDEYCDFDEDELSTIEFPDTYTWWHEGLSPNIKEGFIHEWIREWQEEQNEFDWEDEYFVLTGKFENYDNREELMEELMDYGANVQSSISKKTTVLVTGQRVGASKLEKAKQQGIRIMTEEELMDLME